MKKLLNQIDSLYANIESGLLTKSEAMSQLRELRFSMADRYEVWSDEFTELMHSLLDVHYLIEDLY
jgi:hypothetical protein